MPADERPELGPGDAKDGEPEQKNLTKYLRYSHVGVQFFIAVALFTGGGIWLDKRFGTVVLFTLVGLALGFGGGLIALYRDIYPRRRRGDAGPNKPSQPEAK